MAREKQGNSMRAGQVLLLAVPAIVVALACSLQWRLPSVVPASAPRTVISGERMMKVVEDLTAFGIRNVASDVNEVSTAQFMVEHCEAIAEVARKNGWRAEVQVQRATNAISFDFIMTYFTNAFTDVKNVLLRLSPRPDGPMEGSDAILVSSHYDSTLGTVGATDDGAAVASMVELLTVLAHQSPAAVGAQRDVVANFNGAEESFLQAAFGFARAHPWARDVRAFVNLEAVGGDGPSIVFQTSPRHAWLSDLLAEALPHPHATVIAQDIFTNQLIPSDTDFRIYRDFSGPVLRAPVSGAAAADIPPTRDAETPSSARRPVFRAAPAAHAQSPVPMPGVDMAFYHHGHVYHTKVDDAAHTSPASLQHMGDNALAAVRALLRLQHVPPLEGAGGDSVFFDVWGLVMVALPRSSAAVLYALVGLGYALTVASRGAAKAFRAAAYVLAMVAATVVGTAAYGTLLSLALGVCMPWYAHEALGVLMYLPVALLLLLETARAAAAALRRADPARDAQRAERDLALGLAGVHVLLMAVLARANLGSAYLAALLAGSALTAAHLGRLLPLPTSWPARQAIAVAVPVGHTAPLAVMLLMLVQPTMGRVGQAPSFVPELALGAVVALVAVLVAAPLAPYAPHVPRRGAAAVLAAVAVAAAAVAVVVHPYDVDHPKRILAHHLHTLSPVVAARGAASHAAPAAEVLSSEVLFSGFDPQPKSMVRDMVAGVRGKDPVLHWSAAVPVTDQAPWQVYYPVSSFMLGLSLRDVPHEPRLRTSLPTVWVHGPPEQVTVDGEGVGWNVTLAINTLVPTWSTLNITGSDVLAWSFNEVRPKVTCPPLGPAAPRPCSFVVRHTAGERAAVWTAWLVARSLPVRVSLGTLFVDDNGSVGTALLSHLPDWTSVIAHAGTLQTLTIDPSFAE